MAPAAVRRCSPSAMATSSGCRREPRLWRSAATACWAPMNGSCSWAPLGSGCSPASSARGRGCCLSSRRPKRSSVVPSAVSLEALGAVFESTTRLCDLRPLPRLRWRGRSVFAGKGRSQALKARTMNSSDTGSDQCIVKLAQEHSPLWRLQFPAHTPRCGCHGTSRAVSNTIRGCIPFELG